jgi:hypothetical protein
MNNSINQLINKAKLTFNQAFAHAKETIYTMTGTSSASVQQIADYIISHPDTKVERKQYIGVPLSFYELKNGEMNYYLEMNNHKVLQLDVHSHSHSVVSYRSYRDQLSLNTPVKFPELSDPQS